MANVSPPSPTEQSKIARDLAQSEEYGAPRRVWVEDGHVFVERHDGTIVHMTPEVAIELGRKISNAGADSLVNKVREDAGLPDTAASTQG